LASGAAPAVTPDLIGAKQQALKTVNSGAQTLPDWYLPRTPRRAAKTRANATPKKLHLLA
jgi:hypothetical protein